MDASNMRGFLKEFGGHHPPTTPAKERAVTLPSAPVRPGDFDNTGIHEEAPLFQEDEDKIPKKPSQQDKTPPKPPTVLKALEKKIITMAWKKFYEFFFAQTSTTLNLPIIHNPMQQINDMRVVPPLEEWYIQMNNHNLEAILEAMDYYEQYLPRLVLTTHWSSKDTKWTDLLQYKLEHVRNPTHTYQLNWRGPTEYRPAYHGQMLTSDFRQSTMTLPEFLIFQLFHRCMLGKFHSIGSPAQHFILLGTRQPGIGYPTARCEQDTFWFGWMPSGVAMEGYWAPQISPKL